MSELSGPADHSLMRVSDSDREQAAEVLREAAGQGRISLDELDERLESAYAAKTYADLAVLIHDLPQSGQVPAPPVQGAIQTSRIGGTPRSKFSVAIMSGARRMGRWVVPRTYVSVAVMGGIELDLRDAQFSEPVVTLHAYTLMGGIQITVPEDVDVDVSGVAFMGGFDHDASGPGVPGAPQVRVLGFALMGGVEVRRKPVKVKRGKVEDGSQGVIGNSGSQDAIEG
jgi:Domain of unknown function (DUF1707)/Cell wall-active antibiotics response 4TMS YvqF